MLNMARKKTRAVDSEDKSAPEGAKEKSSEKSSKAVAQKTQTGPSKSVWREYFESAIYTAIMFVFFITFIGRTVGVPTGSMQNTIFIGDHFLINKFVFAPGSHPFFLPQREIRRGDIIVFKYPGDRYNKDRDAKSNPPVTPYKDYFIKRVIGLPGETIEVRGPYVYINGNLLPEHRVTAGMGITGVAPDKAPLTIYNTPARSGEPYMVYYKQSTMSGEDEPIPEIFHFAVGGKPYTIPPNSYFVMGDNRDDSADSRAWGPVEADLIVGRALFVFWSNDESAPRGNFLIDFFKNTRWWRTGTMIK